MSLSPLSDYLSNVYAYLADFAVGELFWTNFTVIYGMDYDFAKAEAIRSRWANRDFGDLPLMEVVSVEVLGSALGGYAASNNTIYLSEALLASDSFEQIVAVILEEIGHYVDSTVNVKDTTGDEGAYFASVVLGQPLSEEQLKGLLAEDDLITLTIDGQLVLAEAATLTGTNGNDTLTGTVGNDTISPLRGKDNVDGGDGTDLLIVDYSSNTYAGTSNPAGLSVSISQQSDGFGGSLSAQFGSAGSDFDLVNFNRIERFQITGTNAADTINVLPTGSTFNGGAGADTINFLSTGSTFNGESGIDTVLNANFSSATVALTIDDSDTAKSFTVPDGTSILNVERFTNLTLGSGADVVNFTQRITNQINTGAGNDTINAGFGKDNVDGGDGTDLLIVDYSSNTYAGTSNPAGLSVSISQQSDGFGGSLSCLLYTSPSPRD